MGQAYRNTTTEQAVSNLNNGSKFSIQTDNNGNKYVNVDVDQDTFKRKSLAEQTKIAKQYILDNFRQNGINVNNENINVTSKTANEYTHPKKGLNKSDMSSKLKASTELDNLLLISKYQYSKLDDGRHPFAKDGWNYYKTTFKVEDNLFEGIVNIGKSGNKKTLYDITNIKRIDQNRSTSANAFSTSLVNSIDGNVPQSNANVNTPSTKYSMQNDNNNSELQSYLEENYKSNGKKTYFKELNIPKSQKVDIPPSKTLNPVELSKLTPETADTTPTLNTKKYNKSSDENSKFYNNIKNKVNKPN